MNAESSNRQAIESRAEFLLACRTLLTELPESGARDVACVDVDFGDWPLGEPEIVDALTRWVRLPGRRLMLIGMRFDLLAHRQPRFAEWRRDRAHLMQCLSPVDLDASDMPCLLVAAPAVLELYDRDRWRGALVNDPHAVRPALERVEAISQRCEPAWPADVLGL